MKMHRFGFIIVLFMALTSCDQSYVFDQYKSINNIWTKKDAVVFTLPELPVDKQYNTYINIRDNNDYPFNNIFLIVSLEQPNKKVVVDTLEYQMTNLDGSLLGDGFSDIKESKLVYKEKYKFAQKGIYKITIRHALRQTGKAKGIEKLEGITDIGFRIEEIK